MINKEFTIILCGKTMCADFVELVMHDFDVILSWTCFIFIILVWIVVVDLYDFVSLMKKS